MKKLPLLVLLGLTVFCVMPLAAQLNVPKESQSELYYVNIPIEKVYPTRLGYIVMYRSGVNKIATAYIPYQWFRAETSKADLVQMGAGKTWPCMSIFYKEGAFHAVRLYVSAKASHQTWGTIPSNVNLDSRFEGVETLTIDY
jgi:hypothetical protein